MFTDRKETGELLAKELLEYKNDKEAILLAIPRGGVIPGYEISRQLHIPLELVLVKKIGHPTNKEYAIGAVSLNSKIIHSYVGVTDQYINEEVEKIRKKLVEQQHDFIGNRKPLSLKDKKVIIVDDGIATGLTLLMVIEFVRNENPSEIIVAVPVAPPDSVFKIKPMVGKFICLLIPEYFRSVGEFYRYFDQVDGRNG